MNAPRAGSERFERIVTVRRSRLGGRLLRAGWGGGAGCKGGLGADGSGTDDESADQRVLCCLPIIHGHLPRGMRLSGFRGFVDSPDRGRPFSSALAAWCAPTIARLTKVDLEAR